MAAGGEQQKKCPTHLLVLYLVTAGKNGEKLGTDEEQIVLLSYLLYDVANKKVCTVHIFVFVTQNMKMQIARCVIVLERMNMLLVNHDNSDRCSHRCASCKKSVPKATKVLWRNFVETRALCFRSGIDKKQITNATLFNLGRKIFRRISGSFLLKHKTCNKKQPRRLNKSSLSKHRDLTWCSLFEL